MKDQTPCINCSNPYWKHSDPTRWEACNKFRAAKDYYAEQRANRQTAGPNKPTRR